jgi:hypothetical protein
LAPITRSGVILLGEFAKAMTLGLLHPGGWGVFCSVLLSNGRDLHTTDDHNHLAPWKKAHCRILDPGLANENLLGVRRDPRHCRGFQQVDRLLPRQRSHAMAA